MAERLQSRTSIDGDRAKYRDSSLDISIYEKSAI